MLHFVIRIIFHLLYFQLTKQFRSNLHSRLVTRVNDRTMAYVRIVQRALIFEIHIFVLLITVKMLLITIWYYSNV